MANASANRLIQVPHRGLSLVLKTTFHNAVVKALLDDQWLTIIKKHPHAEETNAPVRLVLGTGCSSVPWGGSDVSAA